MKKKKALALIGLRKANVLLYVTWVAREARGGAQPLELGRVWPFPSCCFSFLVAVAFFLSFLYCF